MAPKADMSNTRMQGAVFSRRVILMCCGSLYIGTCLHPQPCSLEPHVNPGSCAVPVGEVHLTIGKPHPTLWVVSWDSCTSLWRYLLTVCVGWAVASQRPGAVGNGGREAERGGHVLCLRSW